MEPDTPQSSDTMLVLSPHLDDAVFGCGDALAARPGSTVVTLFAGSPPPPQPLTRWDEAAGFLNGDDAVPSRQAEDRNALQILNARPVWLPFLDEQYGAPPDIGEMTSALEQAIASTAAALVVIPLGLWHRDHRLAHDVAIRALRRHPEVQWQAYEDAIYRRLDDDGLCQRLFQLRRDGLHVELVDAGMRATDRKRRSVACYESQVQALAGPIGPGIEDIFEPERLWTLIPSEAAR